MSEPKPRAATSSDSPEMTPERIGPYRIERLLGEGAFARVYLARCEARDEAVALKVLRADIDASVARQVRTRFLLEARIANAIPDPRIVRVHATSEFGDSPCFLALEYVKAESFASALAHERERGSVAGARYLGELARLGREIAEALAVAHAHGIVHRDLKPDNVLVTLASGERCPAIKIVDFGIAKAPHEILSRCASAGFTPHSTELGTVMGSLPYMAPEQNGRAHAVTGKADVFALGVMLTIAAVGLDFDVFETARASWTLPDDFERTLALGPELPNDLRSLLARMLEVSPDDRPEMREVACELARLAQPDREFADAVYAWSKHHRAPNARRLRELLLRVEHTADLASSERDFLREAPAHVLARRRPLALTCALGALTALTALLAHAYATERERAAELARNTTSAHGAEERFSELERSLARESEQKRTLLTSAASQERRLERLDKLKDDLTRIANQSEDKLSRCRSANEELAACARERELCETESTRDKSRLERLSNDLDARKHELDEQLAATAGCRRDLDARSGELGETASRLRLCSESIRQGASPSPTDPPAP